MGNLENLAAPGRLKFFLENWKKLTNNRHILKIIQGYQVPLSSKPIQCFLLSEIQMKHEEQALADQEIEKKIEKQAIKLVQPANDHFLTTFFLVPKKDSGHHSSDQFK